MPPCSERLTTSRAPIFAAMNRRRLRSLSFRGLLPPPRRAPRLLYRERHNAEIRDGAMADRGRADVSAGNEIRPRWSKVVDPGSRCTIVLRRIASLPARSIGPYEILDQIGAGGMGQVHKARDTRLNRTVAIKVLTDAAHIAGGGNRLLREAQAASALNHPNIVTVHDVLSVDGCDVIVIDYRATSRVARFKPLCCAPPTEAPQEASSCIMRTGHTCIR